jgi:tRNA threonylcarbamoyladenosine modification (KEOPS) complex  Pcc1 subunit
MKKESGLTLVELLAAITILFIIVSLIYGVFIGINKDYRQISSRVNMEQEANIITNTIKNYHQHQDHYLLSYDPTAKKAFIGGSSANIQLEPDTLDIVIKINNTDFSGVQSIDSSIPLDISITLVTKQGQSYSTNTIIKRY